MKPNLVFTAERRIEQHGREPIRLAVTMQAWTDREVAEGLDNAQIQAALTKAGQQISADLFGDGLPIAQEPESCKSCRFWAAQFERRDFATNNCRRHAPRLIEGPTTRFNEWPRTMSTVWCGDYQRFIPTAEERS